MGTLLGKIYYGSESGGECAPERMRFYSPPEYKGFLEEHACRLLISQ